MNTVKELRDKLARAKGELAKEARRRAEAEEARASSSELQNELINEQRALLAARKENMAVQKEHISELRRYVDIAEALIASLHREAEERNARMADLERRLAKYEEVDPPGGGAEKAESGGDLY